MADYIGREKAIEIICGSCAFKAACDAGVEPRCSYYIRMTQISAADVVTREAFNLILAENDIMREQLAKIGKKPGDRMDDVIKLPTFEEGRTGKWINCLPVPWWDLQNKVDEIDKVKE